MVNPTPSGWIRRPVLHRSLLKCNRSPSLGLCRSLGSGWDCFWFVFGEAGELTSFDLIDEIAVGSGSCADSSYFFNCLLRSKILRANHKDDACDEFEGVLQHKLFHFPVASAAPMGPG